jgi:hypothetical protein
MKMDLNKLVHNIDGINDIEDEDETEERKDYYDIKKEWILEENIFQNTS